MIHYVYKITNLENRKEYIGVRTHANPDSDDYMGSSIPLKEDIQKTGLASFKKEILQRFETRQEAEAREAELVNRDYIQRADTYNIRTGGSMGHPMQAVRYDVYNEHRAIVDRYINGDSAEQLARDYSVDANVIRNIIPKDVRRTQSQANKLTRKTHPPASMRKDINKYTLDIIKSYQNGDSVDGIAAQYNCHRDVIKRLLKESNVPMRSMSEQQKLRKDISQPKRKDLWSRISEIKTLYSEGKNYAEIARLFNTSDTQIRNMIKKTI